MTCMRCLYRAIDKAIKHIGQRTNFARKNRISPAPVRRYAWAMDAQSSRVADISRTRVGEALSEDGFSRMGILLSPSECKQLRSLYPEPEPFRTRMEMARYPPPCVSIARSLN